MSTAPVKNPGGRPSPYDRETYPELALKFCLLGATNRQLADFFDVVQSTIDLWISTHEEFSTAVRAGRHEADANVVKSLYQRALDGDTVACIFWLKNRRPDKWRDRHEYAAETREPPTGPLDQEKLRTASQEELESVVAFMKKYSIN